jgi:hypothetical protein
MIGCPEVVSISRVKCQVADFGNVLSSDPLSVQTEDTPPVSAVKEEATEADVGTS